MRAKNAIKIAVGNYSLVFKNLLYKLVIFTIFAILLRIILAVALTPFMDAIRPVFSKLASLIVAILNGEGVAGANDAFEQSIGAFYSFIVSRANSIVIMIIILAVMVLLYRFLSGISDCTLMILVNEHMTGLSRRGYLSVMIENLKKILVYQLIDALSITIYSTIVVLLMWGVLRLAIITIPIGALFGTVLVYVVAKGLYLTVFSQIMANLLIGEKKPLKKAVLDALTVERRYFLKMFASYFTVSVVLFYLHTTVTIFTFGVGEILLIPFASLMIAVMKTVDYFTITKKKYFVDYDTIIVPKELRENDEELLSGVEI